MQSACETDAPVSIWCKPLILDVFSCLLLTGNTTDADHARANEHEHGHVIMSLQGRSQLFGYGCGIEGYW